MSGFIPQIVETALRIGEQTGRSVRFKRPTIQRFPMAAERGYTEALVRIVRAVALDIRELLVKDLTRLSSLSGLRPDEERADIFNLADIIDRIEDQLEIRLSNTHLRDLEQLTEEYRSAIDNKNRFEIIKQIRRSLGVDAMVPEPQLNDMLNLWKREQQRLVTKMTREQIEDAGNIARRGIRAGDRPEVIAERIAKRTGITINKARLIARDQTNKLNGALTRMRQTNLGVEEYIWRTSRDERVRPSHIAKEGRTFRWDDPPADTGHPGQDILCRCSAEPKILGIPRQTETAAQKKRVKDLQKAAGVKPKTRKP